MPVSRMFSGVVAAFALVALSRLVVDAVDFSAYCGQLLVCFGLFWLLELQILFAFGFLTAFRARAAVSVFCMSILFLHSLLGGAHLRCLGFHPFIFRIASLLRRFHFALTFILLPSRSLIHIQIGLRPLSKLHIFILRWAITDSFELLKALFQGLLFHT